MSFLEAIRFLTLIPIPFGLPKDQSDYERNIARAMGWFAVVGLLIGAIGVGVGWLASLWFDATVRAVLIVITLAVVTAGLHLDGLSDTFDAVFSWRSRERKLEIMKDSRIGAMGAMALIVVLLLKTALLASTPHWWLGVLLAPAVGRWVDLYGIFFFPAAAEGGLGANYRKHIRPRDFAFATVTLLAILGALGYLAGSPALISRVVLAPVLALAVAHVIFAGWTRSLGGLTGDTYGAMCEIAEVVVLAAVGSYIL